LTTSVDARDRRSNEHSLQERDHDLLSALVAIEGGLRALQRGRTGDEDLVGALVREVAFARGLLAPPSAVGVDGPAPVGALLASLGASERARGARVEVRVDGELWADLPEERLHQVLRNLLDNARRHAPGALVQLSAVAEPTAIVIRVVDDGPGIAADQLAAVTRRGVRGSRSTGGSGLGLHLATSLVAAAAGTLSINSDPGGTTITVRVPRAGTAAVSELRR
jgi:two-component system OmpR family sensor kinase